MHLKNVLGFLGLWSYPFGLAISGSVACFLPSLNMQQFTLNAQSITGIALGGLIAPCFVTISNLHDFLIKGRRDFSPDFSVKKSVTSISDSKKQAMYKKVGKEDGLLSDKPEGLIFGKQGKKYVTLPVGKEGMRDGVSAVALGSPGSGKSVFLTNFLLNNFQQENPTPVFALDIKPELAQKSVKTDECKKVKVVDFTDRAKAGWNVYFSISEKTKDDEKIRCFDGISRALIVSSNPKDKFFVNNARTILKFLLLYYFNQGIGFIDSITKIMAEDVSEHIKKVLEDKEYCPEGGIVYNGLKKYVDKESEATQDQDFSQIEKIYSKEEARTLMNLSEVTYALSCKDQETTKILSDLIGDYREEKVSHNRSGLLHCATGQENVSTEYRRIMETADFQTLREKKEAILILYGKYFRYKAIQIF